MSGLDDAAVGRLRDKHVAGCMALRFHRKSCDCGLPALLDALAAAERRAERAELKAEQYAKQLDDRWTGVVTLTNEAVAANAALTQRAEALARERDEARRERDTLAEDEAAAEQELQIAAKHAVLQGEQIATLTARLADTPENVERVARAIYGALGATDGFDFWYSVGGEVMARAALAALRGEGGA